MLKESVVECSQKLDSAHQELNQAKQFLENSWNESTSLQREHSELLRSRDRWTPDDANRFAELLQREVTLRDDLATAKTQAKSAEDTVASLRLEYMDRLRRRYQEEQVWQDKWRIIGTYGTWSLIVLNSLVFGMSQILYQRRELERMRQMEALLDERLPPGSKLNEEHDEDKTIVRETANHGAIENEQRLDDNGTDAQRPNCAIPDVEDSTDQATSRDCTFLSVQWWMQGVKEATLLYQSHLHDSFHLPSAIAGAAAAGLLVAMVVRN